MIYYPEMNEKPEPRLFATSYNYRDSYSICWAKSRDNEAKETLKRLNIRPLKCSPIRAQILGEWSALRQFNEDGFSCLISSKAQSKLFERDLCAHKMLLD